MSESMLSTIDNPWNPFTHYMEWFGWDANHGYHCPSYLARVINTSSDLSEADQALAIDRAIELIVKENVSGVFIKVTKED